MICPQHCVCQYAHRMDLSISRWIHAVETRQRKGHEFVDSSEDALTNNEVVTFEDDIQPQNNELLKFTMCLLPSNIEPKDLIASLPHDVEALVILSTENRKNLSVLVSDFNQLFDLKTLEIRGSKETEFTLRFDEPISWVNHLSIESVHVEAAETMRFRPNLEDIDPSQNFHYVPNCEKFEYNISFETPEELKELEIVPYEVYKMEKLTSELRMKTISFYGWDNLKVLSIKGCEMHEIYWEMFDGLSNLEHLALENNGIKEVPAFSFYGTPNIKTLSLANNEIFDLTYRSLAGLLELQLLDISDNNIGKLSEQTFPPFPKLQIVDLRHNPIKNLFPAIFGVMNKTEVLYLGSENVPLELNARKPFEYLTSLVYLEIPNLSVPQMDQNTFASLDNLQILKIRSGNIPFIEFDTFSKMLKLKELHIRHCKIEEISMDTFFGAKNLEIVDLSHNLIKEVPPGLFDDQHDLTEILLVDNQLKTLPSDIFRLNSLKMIHLLDNPWECNCDMKFWRQEMTNKFRSGKTDNKCSGNVLKHDKLNCDGTTTMTYTFDHKLSPRCKTPSNLEGKSVFYALRRVLNCASFKSASDALNPPKVTEKPQKKIAIKHKYEKHVRDQKKKKQKEAQRNSLHYQLFQRRNYENLQVRNFNSLDNNEMSNDL
ncbi:CLUMA_CG019640, isoform A [Clunio marinus]|uniref:CLUMA_CG019640, isoform A n=1 Tax=Clunio marinus TaxID=568069 RepID=A0A1J1J1U3_9DIPT|nr:CLUMA_CG019640, isoform A [Clunio marinus]